MIYEKKREIESWTIPVRVKKIFDIGSGAGRHVEWMVDIDMRGIVRGLRETYSALPQEEWTERKMEIYDRFIGELPNKIYETSSLLLGEGALTKVNVDPWLGPTDRCLGECYAILELGNPLLGIEDLEYVVSTAIAATAREITTSYGDKSKSKSPKVVFED